MKKLTLVAALLTISSPLMAADSYLNNAGQTNQNFVKENDSSATQLFSRTTRLSSGSQQKESFDATAGRAYSVFADCDTSCSNIDMVIRQNGREVFKESGSNDAPLFSWVADSAGRYDIEVTMKDCSGNRCRVQTQVYEGSKALPANQQNGADWLLQAQKINREKIQNADANAIERPVHNHELAEENEHTQNIELTEGKYYGFFADCDRNCSDIDMTLSQNGRNIFSLTDPGDAPETVWRANRTGQYQLTIKMEDCDADKCAYSSQIFESNKDLDTSLISAQEQNRRIVREKDSGAREILLRQVRLPQGQNLTLPLTLRAGKVYTFYGDCDNNCSDIDLTLSQNGRELKSDTLGDSVPLFSYRATRSGSYTVTIPMKACSSEDCAVSAHIFEGTKMIYDNN